MFPFKLAMAFEIQMQESVCCFHVNCQCQQASMAVSHQLTLIYEIHFDN